MAFVALTDEQKNLLGQNPRFPVLVEYSLLDKSRYWVQLDGTSVPGNDYVKWAKTRHYAANVFVRNVLNAKNTEFPSLALTFLTQPVWNNSVTFNTDTVIDYMISSLTFEVLADNIFDTKIKEVLF